MRKKELLRRLDLAHAKVQTQINNYAARSRHAQGFAGEGYKGGYRDALSDVVLLINGTNPRRRGWWEE